MLVLLDKNVPHGVRQFLDQHQVETVDERGWERISNGELIQAAEAAGFEVVLTADQNIVYQQNLKARKDRSGDLRLEHLADCARARSGDYGAR